MQAVVIGREVLMYGCRVWHVLGEPERFESTHAARKERLPVIAENDNLGRDRVERKETAQKLGTLADIDAGLVLLGSNMDDAFRMDAEAGESVHEFVPLRDPRLPPDPIKPEFPIEREQDRGCTVDTVGPDHGDHAVRELSDRGARFWLSTTSRCVGHAPIGAVAREREVDAGQEPLEITRPLSLALPRQPHLRERVDVHREAAGLHLGNLRTEAEGMQVVMRRRLRQLYPKGGCAELRERGQRDDLVRVVLRQNPTGRNLALLVVQKGRRSAGLLRREDRARHRVGAHPTV